jgi:hypothetical protein
MPPKPEKSSCRHAITWSLSTVVLVSFLFGCAEQPVGLPHPAEQLLWPTSFEIGPNGRYAFVVNSNFDQKYRSGTVAVVDLEEETVLGNTTLNIAAFGGIVTPGFTTNTAPFDRLFVPSRESNKMYQVDVAWPSDGSAPSLDCGGPTVDGLKTCAEGHIVEATPEETEDTQPFATAVLRDHNGNEILVTAGLANGTVYFWGFGADGDMVLLEQRDVGLGIQSILFHPGQGMLLFTHRNLAILSVLPISFGVVDGATALSLGKYRAIGLPHNPASTNFGRGMVLHPDSARVVVAWRSPSSLLVLEPDPNTAAGFRLTDQIDVGQGAGQIVFANMGVGHVTRAFVTSFIEDRIYVVDIDSGTVEDFVNVGRGPYAIRAFEDPVESERWLITADFEDGTLTIVQGDSDQEDYLQIIKTVGGSGDDQ